MQLPLEGVGQLDDVQTGWLIPGLMKSRIVALIRSLPKPIRRNLVPAPDTATKVAERIEFGRGIFFEVVARELSKFGGAPIDPALFKTEKLDDHLKVNLQVINQQGEIIAQGRSVAEIRSQLGAEHASSVVEVEDETWNQDGLLLWSWEDLPEEIMITRGGTRLAAFPAIVDQHDSVGLRLTDSKNAGDMTSRQGLVRLLQISNRKLLRSQVNWLPDLDRYAITLSSLMPSGELKSQLADLITRVAFIDRKPIPRSKSEFEELRAGAVEQISIASQDVAKWLPKLADAFHEVQLKLEGLSDRFATTKGDVRSQLAELKSEEFLARTPWQWLQHYPRYLQAISYRVEKLDSTPVERDRSRSNAVGEFWQRYADLTQLHRDQAIVDPELETFRWMIEELRVSLFAQPLGTSLTVSPARMEKQWKKVRLV